jgi:hypothetical protein
MNLHEVGKLVAAYSGETSPDQISKAEIEKAIVKKMFAWIAWGLAIMGVGIVMLVINKSFDLGKWFGLCSVFLMLFGVGIAAAGVIRTLIQGTNIPTMLDQATTAAEPTKFLTEERIPVPMVSVTERTTQLIAGKDAENETKSR